MGFRSWILQINNSNVYRVGKTVLLTLEIKHLRNGMPESQFVLIWSKLSYDRLKLIWSWSLFFPLECWAEQPKVRVNSKPLHVRPCIMGRGVDNTSFYWYFHVMVKVAFTPSFLIEDTCLLFGRTIFWKHCCHNSVTTQPIFLKLAVLHSIGYWN